MNKRNGEFIFNNFILCPMLCMALVSCEESETLTYCVWGGVRDANLTWNKDQEEHEEGCGNLKPSEFVFISRTNVSQFFNFFFIGEINLMKENNRDLH